MVSLLAPLAVLVSLGAGPDEKADKKELSETEKKAAEAIRKTLNASGPAIDKCTGRYLTEQPAARGQARIDVTVAKTGRVKKAEVTTKLPQARTLRLCLEFVARAWTFPPPRKPAPFGLTVPVAPGSKFRLAAAGEKPPPPAKKKEEPEGFLKLRPGSFLPNLAPEKTDQ